MNIYDIIVAVNHIVEYYKKQDEKFDEEVFSTHFHHALQFIDKDILKKLRILISDISVYNIFNYPLLLNDFHKFIKNGNINNTSFLKEKIKVMKSENISFIKKINSCTDFNKLKEQINKNLVILKHFKSVCEYYQVCVLNSHNFIAHRIKCLFINGNADNSIVLVGGDYVKIKAMIAREDRFKSR